MNNQKGHIIFISFLIALAAGLIAISYNYFFKPKNSNEVDKIAEEIIKDETGIDINFEPATDINKLPIKKVPK
jgi:hypothetical protein